jgi:hypothetical protein
MRAGAAGAKRLKIDGKACTIILKAHPVPKDGKPLCFPSFPAAIRRADAVKTGIAADYRGGNSVVGNPD